MDVNAVINELVIILKLASQYDPDISTHLRKVQNFQSTAVKTALAQRVTEGIKPQYLILKKKEYDYFCSSKGNTLKTGEEDIDNFVNTYWDTVSEKDRKKIFRALMKIYNLWVQSNKT